MSSINSSEDDKKNENNINSNVKSISKEEKPKEEENQNKSNNNNIIKLSDALKDPNIYNNIKSIISAIFNYQVDALNDVNKMERDFKTIGEKYTKRLPFDYMDRLKKFKEAILLNYTFLFKVASPYRGLFKYYKDSSGEVYFEPLNVQTQDLIGIRSNLRLFARDWSSEGIEERNETYKPILNELKSYFKNKSKKDFENGIKVLVPGAGLGRLLYEIGKLGFKVEGNELSFNMLLFYSYLIDNNLKKNEIIIQPFIHTLNNLLNFETAFKKIMIPDENIKEELSKTETGELNMIGGEFCAIYKEKINVYDSIVTCFFIDTANNIIQYIEIIHNSLKSGGLWLNIGPLFYLHTDNPNEVNIQLGWNDIKDVIIGFGFELTKEEIIETTYSSDKDSMMNRVYRCIFFSAVKKK